MNSTNLCETKDDWKFNRDKNFFGGETTLPFLVCQDTSRLKTTKRFLKMSSLPKKLLTTFIAPKIKGWLILVLSSYWISLILGTTLMITARYARPKHGSKLRHKGGTSGFAYLETSICVNLLHPRQSLFLISLMFFYLSKPLFSGFVLFKGNFVRSKINAKILIWAPLMKLINLMNKDAKI